MNSIVNDDAPPPAITNPTAMRSIVPPPDSDSEIDSDPIAIDDHMPARVTWFLLKTYLLLPCLCSLMMTMLL
jgi:hypothetical protein